MFQPQWHKPFAQLNSVQERGQFEIKCTGCQAHIHFALKIHACARQPSRLREQIHKKQLPVCGSSAIGQTRQDVTKETHSLNGEDVGRFQVRALAFFLRTKFG
jgi:hypothetical protein